MDSNKKDPIERLRSLSDFTVLTRECAEDITDSVETQYMKLPLDADGVPIRPGDEVLIDPQSPTIYEVEAVNDDEVVLDGMFLRPADECRRVKPETVESILGEAIQFGAHAATGTRLEGVIAEFAERIRKAVE